jgi:uncharacterized protein YcbX
MLGTVAALRRYPVKSMLGEDLDEAEVSRSGLARDRRLAVVSRRTGKVASAKYPRLWRDLLTLSAEALDDATARITLPGGPGPVRRRRPRAPGDRRDPPVRDTHPGPR